MTPYSFDGASTDRTKPHLIVCTPGSTFSGKWLEAWDRTFYRLVQFYDVTRIYGEGNNIHGVRNDCVVKIAEAARDDPPRYVLWIDSDNIIDPDGAEGMIRVLDELLEASAVGAWYFMEMHDGSPAQIAAGMTDGRRPTLQDIQKGNGDLMEVDYLGFGFLVMRYSVLDQLGAYPFTPILREDGDFETDDRSFCMRAQKAGHRLFLASGVHSPHLKLRPIAFSQRAINGAARMPEHARHVAEAR